MATLFGKPRRKRVRSSTIREEEEVDDQHVSPAAPEKESDSTLGLSRRDDDYHQGPAHRHTTHSPAAPSVAFTFEELGLAEPLVQTCRQLGFHRPTPIQQTIIPFLLAEGGHQNPPHHVLALAETGSGKTAAFVLPLLHHLAADPYGIFAVILTPTRELAVQIHQQILALGSAYQVTSVLVVGGLDTVRQACALDRQPHFVVATPGRLATLLRGPQPPKLQKIRYLVLDEADRLLAANSGFERDVAELLIHGTAPRPSSSSSSICQTLLFSATMTSSLQQMAEMASAGVGRLPLKTFVVGAAATSTDPANKQTDQVKNHEEDDPVEQSNDADSSIQELKVKIPQGLKQEYIFMPNRVRDAYLLATLRTLMANGGRPADQPSHLDPKTAGKRKRSSQAAIGGNHDDDDDDDDAEAFKARSAIVFVSSCERTALVSGILSHVGVDNVALHSLLSQNRRLAALAKFKSQQVRVLVATDVASRGLDIPTVDLVVNAELPRHAVSYVHRVGRTARAGRRGRAVSLVSESDVALVHAAEKVSGRPLDKCLDVTDDMAIQLLGPVAKAARLTKMKLMDIGFEELVQKFKERKDRDRKERERIERALRRMEDHSA